MKAKLFHDAKGCCGSVYCIDQKVHVQIGYGYTVYPCDGRCIQKEVDFREDDRLGRMNAEVGFF